MEAHQAVVEAVGHLVDLAIAPQEDLNPAGFSVPEQEMFDLSHRWETDAVRTEFVRLAAIRALRRIELDSNQGDVLTELRSRAPGADPEALRHINIAMAFVPDGTERP